MMGEPIAVGYTVYHLDAEVAGSYIMGTMGAVLAPRQLCYGTPRGQKLPSMHAARHILDSLQHSEVILKLDFKNTLNTIGHDNMLNACRSLVPELFPLPTQLQSMASESSTCTGSGASRHCHQGRGTAVGPPCTLLIYLTIHELCTQLEQDLFNFCHTSMMGVGVGGGGVDCHAPLYVLAQSLSPCSIGHFLQVH